MACHDLPIGPLNTASRVINAVLAGYGCPTTNNVIIVRKSASERCSSWRKDKLILMDVYQAIVVHKS